MISDLVLAMHAYIPEQTVNMINGITTKSYICIKNDNNL